MPRQAARAVVKSSPFVSAIQSLCDVQVRVLSQAGAWGMRYEAGWAFSRLWAASNRSFASVWKLVLG